MKVYEWSFQIFIHDFRKAVLKIDDCKVGKIDVILTKSILRFAGNTLDCLNLVKMLKELGIVDK